MNATPNGEIARRFFGAWRYLGSTIDEQARTVTHHREGDLRADGEIDAVREYAFVGDRLTLRPVGKDQDISWERIR